MGASPNHMPGSQPLHTLPRAGGWGGRGGNPLSLKSCSQTQLSALGLLSLENLHLPQPWVVLGWVGWEGGWVLTGSWAPWAAGLAPSPPPIPAGFRREAGVGATSQGNFCSCPEQTQAGDIASPWLPRRLGPLEFMFIFTAWIPWR